MEVELYESMIKTEVIHTEIDLKIEYDDSNLDETREPDPAAVGFEFVDVKKVIIDEEEEKEQEEEEENKLDDWPSNPLDTDQIKTEKGADNSETVDDMCDEAFCAKKEYNLELVVDANRSDRSEEDYGHVSDGTEAFKCTSTVCEKESMRESSLNINQSLDDCTKPTKCDLCESVLASKLKSERYLNEHMSVDNDVKQFKCGICEKVFKRECNFVRHTSVHRKERIFKCDVCQMKFPNESCLKSHLVVINDNTRRLLFKCDLCGKNFNSRCNLSVHMLVHSDVRLFKCNLCEKEFKDYRCLKRHMVVHNILE